MGEDIVPKHVELIRNKQIRQNNSILLVVIYNYDSVSTFLLLFYQFRVGKISTAVLFSYQLIGKVKPFTNHRLLTLCRHLEN